MKILKTFTDLAEANAYVAQINAGYEKAVEDEKANALEIKTLKTAAAGDKKALDEALNEMTVLGEKLSLTEKHGSEGLIVTVGKKSYTLVGDTFVYGGSVKTAQELSKDKTELTRMVEIGSGALVEIN